jgi:hypothetical protein
VPQATDIVLVKRVVGECVREAMRLGKHDVLGPSKNAICQVRQALQVSQSSHRVFAQPPETDQTSLIAVPPSPQPGH